MTKNNYLHDREVIQEIEGFSKDGEPIMFKSLKERMDDHKKKILNLGLPYNEILKRVEFGNGSIRGQVEKLISLYSRICFNKGKEEYNPFARRELESEIERTAKEIKIKLKFSDNECSVVEMYPLF